MTDFAMQVEKKLEEIIQRLLEGNETDADIEFLKTFDEHDINERIRARTQQQTYAKTSWTPNHGKIGKYYE